MESSLIDHLLTLINQDVGISCLDSSLRRNNILHLRVMLELVNFRIKFRVIASKTLSWNIVWVKFANFFVVKFKPIILAFAAFTLFNKTVIMATFSCSLMYYDTNQIVFVILLTLLFIINCLSILI